MNKLKYLGMLVVITLCASLFPTFTVERTASAEVMVSVWEKDAVPVVQNDPLAADPSVIFDEEAQLYKMWYTTNSTNFADFDTLISALVTSAGVDLTDDLKGFNFQDIANLDSAGVKAVVTHLAGLTNTDIQNTLTSLAPGIAYATSTDGSTWTPVSNALPITGNGIWDAFGFSSPSVIRKSATEYEMWYTGWSYNVTAVMNLFDDLNTMTADNLTTVLTALFINKDPGQLISALQSIDAGYATGLLGDVISILEGSGGTIGRVTSTDGITWAGSSKSLDREPDTNPDYWDIYGVYFPSVVKTATGYEMWYTGLKIDFSPFVNMLDGGGITMDGLKGALTDAVLMQIGRATSPDGITWTKNSTTAPVIAVNFIGAVETGKVRGFITPNVIIDASGGYHMWYTVVDGDPNPMVDFLTGSSGDFSQSVLTSVDFAIWYATSTNGIAWTSVGKVLDAGATGEWDAFGVASPSVLKQGSSLVMYYTGVPVTDPNSAYMSLLNKEGLANVLTAGFISTSIGRATWDTGVDSTITIAAVPGITVPVTGGTPVTSISETDQYTGTVTWSPNDSVFKGDTVYTAAITLTPKDGYTLTGVTANFFTVTGATATNAANAGVVTAVFPVTGPRQLADIVISPYDASIALGYTLQFSATGVYNDTTTDDKTATANWTSTDDSKATIDAAGLATTKAQGTTTIKATFGAVSGNSTFTVTAPVLKSIEITGATTAAAGVPAAALGITGNFSDGNPAAVTTGIIWTSLTPSIATVDDTGIVTGLLKGNNAIIKAMVDGFSDTHTIAITDPVLTSITVLPDNPYIPAGGTLTFTAVGNYSDGSSAALTTGVTWTTDNVVVADINTATGIAPDVAFGTANITATVAGPVTGKTLLTVVNATLNNIIVTPPTANVPKGKTQQYTATGNFSDGNQYDLTSMVTWASSDTAVATIDTAGFAIARGTAGNTTITASLSGITSAPAVLTAKPAEVVSMTITPSNATVPLGKVGMPYYRDYTATGTYSDGTSTVVANADLTWSITNGTGTATNAGNRVTGTATGNVTVTAQHVTPTTGTNVNASTPLTITAKVLDSIAVTGGTTTAAGGTLDLVATGRYSDNSTAAITTSVSWSSSNAGVGYVDAAGKFWSTAQGTTGITASLSGKTSPAHTITVTAATVASITVDPVGTVIPVGSTGNFRAIATRTDGSKVIVTTLAAWASNNTAIATVNNGIVTGIVKGSTNITATYENKTGQVTVVISDATLNSIDVTPDTSSVVAGRTRQYSAIGTYSDASTANITTMVAWSSTDGTGKASVNQAGLVTGQAVGTANITATLSGKTGTEAVTISAAVLDSIKVTPENPTLTFVSGAAPTLQFKATGIYTDGSTTDLTTTATWSIAAGAGATIGAGTGLATTTGAGTPTIQAASGGKNGTTTMTVLADTVAPVVTITSPKQGFTTSQRSIIVTGKINDTNVTTKQLIINGVTTINLTLDASGNFNVGVNLNDGSNTIVAKATDPTANVGTSNTVTVKVDAQKPNITLTSPADGLLTNATTVTISGTATHVDNVSSINVIVNGISKSVVVTGGNFTTTAALSAGTNTICVTGYAKGKEGNASYLGSTGTRTIKVDTTAPVVKINSPINNSVVSIASQTISGTIDDTKVTTAKLSLNGGVQISVPAVDGKFSTVVNLVNGANTLSVVATDEIGNSSTSAVLATVTLDTSKPAVTLVTPENNLRTNSAGQTINGSVSDPTIQTVTLKLNGGSEIIPVIPNGNVGEFSIVKALNEGNNTIEVTATNRAVPATTGTSGVYNVIVDTTPPTIKIDLTDPTDTIKITVTTSEDLKEVPTVDVNTTVVTMTGDGNRQWTGTYSVPAGAGEYTVTAVVTDVAGNKATAKSSFAKAGMTNTSSATVNSQETTLQVETTGDVSGDITVSTHMENPAGNTGNPGDASGVYVEINASPDILNNLSEIYVEVTYNPDLLPAGTDQTKLKLYLWDVATGTWQAVAGSGVDTTRHVIFATLTHLSKYGAFGGTTVTPPAPATTSTTTSGGAPTAGVYYLAAVTTAAGTFTQEFIAVSADELLTLVISKDITATTSTGQRLTSIQITQMTTAPEQPEQSSIIGYAYELTPNGAQFSQKIRVTLSYDPDTLPEGFNERSLVIAWYNSTSSTWVSLEDITVDTALNTVSGWVNHFTPFAVLAYTTPAAFTVSNLTITPAQAEAGKTVIISAVITNTGNLAGTFEVKLKLNGEVAQVKRVTIEGNDRATVTFTTTQSAAGTYTVNVNDLSGSFTISAPTGEPVVEEPVEEEPVEEEPVVETPVEEELVVPTAGIAWWVWLIIGIAVIAAAGAVYIYWWKPRRAA